jgi:hypothetical protein
MQRRQALVLFLTPLLVVSPTAYHAARKKSKTSALTWANGEEDVYRPTVINDLGFDIVSVEKGCIAYSAYFVAPKFFQNLKRTETQGGPVFRQGHRVMSEFPETLLLNVDAGPARCSKDAPPTPTWAGEWPPNFIKTPHIEAVYIRELKPYPLEVVLSEEGEMPGDFPIYTPRLYRFVVKTKGVLLTDRMHFTLSSKDGQKLAEFSFRP